MISGTLEILHGVRSGLVDPLLLPASQGPDMLGYIVISYEEQADVYDILFVRGSHVEEYAGLHRALRTILSEKTIRHELAGCRMNCRVYLYSLPRQYFNCFLLTFYASPSLNVSVDNLTRKQVTSLLEDLGCSNGILEIDKPSRPLPLIKLFRFKSRETLVEQASRVKEGTIIVYDLERNTTLRQRAGAPALSTCDDEEPVALCSAPPNGAGADEAPTPVTVEVPVVPASAEREGPDPLEEKLVGAFRGALAAFQAALLDISGPRLKMKFGKLLARHFSPCDVFEPGLVNISSAPKVLGVIIEGVDMFRFTKRKNLKGRALEIVKELYDANAELLRKYQYESAVQKCYQILER